jgi:hypothetical protein
VPPICSAMERICGTAIYAHNKTLCTRTALLLL